MSDIKLRALAKYLELDKDEYQDISESSYNDNGYDYGNQEYLVCTEDEADKVARDYIQDSLWAFNSNFIIEHSKLPWESEEMIKSFQREKCEGANDTVQSLIEDMDEFVEDAISADGRGHFISSYDGEENEIELEGETYFIYRIN